MESPSESAPLEILAFEVGGRAYALPAARVRELIRVVAIVPLPSASPAIEGVINVRGEIVPVLDIRSRFGLPAKSPALTDQLILVSVGTQVVAIRVDRATGLLRVGPDECEDLRRIIPGVVDVSGIAKLADGLVMIQDLRAFLNDAESTGPGNSLTRPPPPEGER